MGIYEGVSNMEEENYKKYNESVLTDRQKREKEYYEIYVNQLNIDEVILDPIEGKESRPWNPYWYVYELTIEMFGSGNKRLLDFGCGWGETSVRFAKIGYEVSGFDISETNLRVAKNIAKKYGFEKRIEYSLQVAEKLSYPSEYFDIVVGFDILHHVDIEKAIAECKRVLKKGGLAIFKEPVEAQILDYLRNTRLVKYFVPNEKNFTPGRHITEDERKLNNKDITILENIFDEVSIEKFTLTSRLDLFLRELYTKGPSPLEILDHKIFNMFPYARKLGGDAVFVMKK